MLGGCIDFTTGETERIFYTHINYLIETGKYLFKY